MSRPTPVPVYVIHYKAPRWCRDTVTTLLGSDTPVDITVLNNGGQVEPLAGMRVVDMPANLGYTGAANWAITDSKDHPFLVIASHDLLAEPSTVRRMLNAARTHPEAGLLGANVGWRGDNLYGRDGQVEWRDWTSGSCLLLRRQCIDEIGGFDERLHSYGDDVDIAMRAVNAGWKVGRVLDAKAEDRGSSVGRGRSERLIMTNRLLLAYKSAGWPGLLAAMIRVPRRVAYQLKMGVLDPRTFPARCWMACNEVMGAAIAIRRLPRFRDGPPQSH